MQMQRLIPVLLLVSVVIISGCTSVPPVVPPENKCDLNPESCDKTKQDKCYGLNQPQCESTSGCKTSFDTVCGFAGDCHDLYEKCESVETDPATLCNGVTCPAGQACFKGECISTASKKVSLEVKGYRESCSDEPRLFVKKNDKGVEVKNYLWDKVPIYVNGEYKGDPTWCDLLVCSNISKPIEVELISYEKIGNKDGVPEYTTVPITDPVTVELNYYKTEDDCNRKQNAQKFSQVYNDVQVTKEKLCQQGGGEWKNFNNGCADSCHRSEMCTQVLTESCDCGENKCWDEQRCTPTQSVNSSGNLKTVRLNFTIDKWESDVPPEEVHKITNQLLEVREGESFGPIKYNGAPAFEEVKPFTLLEANENSIKVGFHESIVVLGENIGDNSKENPATFSDEKCFRTRTYDAGTDFCIKLMNKT